MWLVCIAQSGVNKIGIVVEGYAYLEIDTKNASQTKWNLEAFLFNLVHYYFSYFDPYHAVYSLSC